MLVPVEIDALSSKGNAFHFEAETLLEGGFAVQLDFASRAEDPLPGKLASGLT